MMMSGDRHASSTSITPEESNMFLDILHEAPLFGHRKPTSIVGSIFYCLLLAGYATLAVGAPWIFHSIQEFILPLLCSCDVALLIVTGIFQQYLVYQVQKIRLQGYYIFSQKLKHIVRLPFASTSYGTAAMLLVMVWKPHIGILSIPMLLRIIMLIEVICAGFFMSVYISGFALTLGEVGTRSLQGREPSQPMEKERKRRQQEWNAFEGQGRYFMAVRCFEIFCGIWMERITGGFSDNFMHFDLFWETMTFLASVLVSTLGIPIFGELSSLIFIGYVHQYNSLESQPDVLKSLYSPLQPSSSLEGLRYHDGGRLSDQQMVLLQYQRENLHFLSEEILRLQECLSKYEKTSDGSTPQVDLAHLLAARDQELRTLSAEMNQSQSELSLARSLIAERDSEIQHFRSTNNQYVEENERLRAMLGEWSTRAAKLERALEIERKSNLELQKKISTLKSKTKHEFVEPT